MKKGGIFSRVAEYGGQYTLKFDQGSPSHPFVKNQQKRLIHKGEGEKAKLIDKGICAGMSLNWLEFQHNNPKGQYSVDGLDLKSINRIIEVQVALRKSSTPLSELLALFGPKSKKEAKAEKPEVTMERLLLEAGIKIISFQAGEKSHVAVAYVTHDDKEITFKLFDAARGEVQFILPFTFKPAGDKDPFAWLQEYLSIYYKHFNEEADININEFSATWVSTSRSSDLYEIITIHNTPEPVIKISNSRYTLISNTPDPDKEDIASIVPELKFR